MAEHKKEAKSGSFAKDHPHAYDFLMLTAAGTAVMVIYIGLTYVAIPKFMPSLSAPAAKAA